MSGRNAHHLAGWDPSLLKEIEHGESRLPEGERFDTRWLRRELAVVKRQRP